MKHPRGSFYRRSAPRLRPPRKGSTRKKATAVGLINQVKDSKRPLLPILTPTAPTRAFISQAKRYIRLRCNSMTIPTPYASRLKRGALKSYITAVSYRASGARPPAMPEQSSRAVSIRVSSVSPDPATAINLKPSKVKNPPAMATYVPKVASLTHRTGSNSRLRMTERGMTEDEHNRGRGPSPQGIGASLPVVSETHAGVTRVGSHRGRHRALRTYRTVLTSTVTALGYFEMCP